MSSSSNLSNRRLSYEPVSSIDRGVITASSSGTTESTHGKNGLDLQNGRTYFFSDDVANAWISRIWR
jgi:hypothetical protein